MAKKSKTTTKKKSKKKAARRAIHELRRSELTASVRKLLGPSPAPAAPTLEIVKVS
ncbi:MAG TPA: hypothetical protein VIF62_31945 [Labilithrix sp.]|jgi:hypothetical protein